MTTAFVKLPVATELFPICLKIKEVVKKSCDTDESKGSMVSRAGRERMIGVRPLTVLL